MHTATWCKRQAALHSTSGMPLCMLTALDKRQAAFDNQEQCAESERNCNMQVTVLFAAT
jgi:hypothetical protein